MNFSPLKGKECTHEFDSPEEQEEWIVENKS